MGLLGTYLIIGCNQCGAKYGVMPEKLVKKEIRFRCKQCKTIVEDSLPDNMSAMQNETSSALPDWVMEMVE